MSALRRCVPFLLYGALLVVSFYPQSLRPWDTVAYIGDSLEAVWVLSWNEHQLFTDPLRVLDANILYPSPRAMTYTDHRIGTSLLVAPVSWLTDNPVLAYNAALAFGCLLAAYAGRRFALLLGIGPLGAWVAGALYAFHTYQINEGPRLHIIYHGFLPLALEQLLKYLRFGQPRQAFFAAGWMLVQAFFSSYHVLYGALLLAIVTMAAFVARPVLVTKRAPMLTAAALTATVLFLPILLPYLTSASTHGFHHELPTGIDLEHYVSTTPTNIVYGPVGAEVRLQQRGPHFVGFVSIALALLALVSWAMNRGNETAGKLISTRIWIPSAALMALFFIALSLGRDVFVFGHHLGPGPYRILHQWVPGFQQVRIPERLSVLAMFFVAMLVGRAVTVIENRGWKRTVWALAVLVPLEHVSPLVTTDRVPVHDNVPAVYSWIKDHPVRALAEVPIHGEGLIRKETLEMYFSRYHGFQPIIHGYESFPPLITSLLRKTTAEFPAEVSLQALQRVGVDTVIVHHGRGDEDFEAPLNEKVLEGRLTHLARFKNGVAAVYESSMDEVYRIESAEPAHAAPYPSGRRVIDPEWTYRTKAGDPLPAADGDISTAWTVRRVLNGDEFFEVTFPRPVDVSGLVMRLTRSSEFPDQFKIAGRRLDGEWVPLAWFDEAHKLQLLDTLLRAPAEASIGFDLGTRRLTGLRIMIEEGGTSHYGWSIPEVEVWVPDRTPPASG